MVSTMKKVDTLEGERGQSLTGLVLRYRRDGRRVYSPAHKQAIVAQCQRPGVSVAATALAHGINANLVRKWIVKHQRSVAAGKHVAVAPAMLLPVTVSAPSTRRTARSVSPVSFIAVELHGARIELTGTVDEQALRTVVHVVMSAAAR
jgi:transposase-like protein